MQCNLFNKDWKEVISDSSFEKVDLVVTDPPYDKNGTNPSHRDSSSFVKFKYSKKTIDRLIDICSDFDINEFCDIIVGCMKNINIYIWCNKTQIIDYFNFFVNGKGCKFDILCWHKSNALPTYHGKYISDTEYCLHFQKNAPVHISNYEDAKTYLVSGINTEYKEWGSSEH